MDVRFERVAEAVAAMHDFEHLALRSSKQSVRPRACKVVLKPVTFACGAYSPAVADATTATIAAAATAVAAATVEDKAHSQQQQQQQQPPPLAVQQEHAAAAAVVAQQQQASMQVKLEAVQQQLRQLLAVVSSACRSEHRPLSALPLMMRPTVRALQSRGSTSAAAAAVQRPAA
jgi:hypothetical protein